MSIGCNVFFALAALATWGAYLYRLGRDHGIAHMVREQSITEETTQELERWLELARSLPSEKELRSRPCADCRARPRAPADPV